MQLPLIIHVARDRLLRLGVQHAPVARDEVLDVVDIRLREAFILRVDLDVVFQHGGQDFRDGSQARRIVQLDPRVRRVGDLVGDEFAREDAVRQTVA
jgi:hypothetical protein